MPLKGIVLVCLAGQALRGEWAQWERGGLMPRIHAAARSQASRVSSPLGLGVGVSEVLRARVLSVAMPPKRADAGSRTPDPSLTKRVLWPSELRRRDPRIVQRAGSLPPPPPALSGPAAGQEGSPWRRSPIPRLCSPFAFYRGAAMIMASDLVATPRSGLNVQCCGDAHLSNFGVFASPERRLVFDLNDFDETLPGPSSWRTRRCRGAGTHRQRL
jgi:hypothetical protein